MKDYMSLECDGFARDPAKVEDQVRLLAWTLREQPFSIMACECDG